MNTEANTVYNARITDLFSRAATPRVNKKRRTLQQYGRVLMAFGLRNEARTVFDRARSCIM